MEEVLNQIGNLGFPIVVSVYLLLRFEKKIDILTVSIAHLNDTIEKMLVTTIQKN